MGQVTYKNPPLNEVTFGLHFSPIVGLRTAHFGLFLSRLRPEFSEALDKPPVSDSPQDAMSAAAGEWLPLPRVWFLHKNKDQLIQLQSNRFYFNWRRNSGAAYPRFEVLLPQFVEYVAKLGEFLATESLGALEVKGFELTYTNTIYEGEGWQGVSQIDSIFPALALSAGRANRMTGLTWHGVFAEEVGRLDMDLKLGRTQEDPPRQVVVLELSTRHSEGPPTMDSLNGWFKAANSTIVSTFGDITNPKLQEEVWGRGGR